MFFLALLPPTVRGRVAIALLSALAPLVWPAQAQVPPYPDRPVRIVTGSAAGASTDIMARVLAQKLSERLGQQFVVDNKPGAASRIGMEFMVKAPPDGYTIGIANAVATNFPLMFDNFPFIPGKDFVPIVMLARAPSFIVVPGSAPIKTVAEFVAYAKSSNGKLSYGHGGIGGATHLATLILVRSLGVEAVGAAYKGNAPTALAVAAGDVNFALIDYPSARPLADSNRLRILAVTEPERVALLPGMPTSGEQGLTHDIDGMTSWFMLVAPGAVPAAVPALLNRHANEVLKQSDVQQTLQGAGVEPKGGTAAEAGSFFQLQRERISAIARDMKLSLRE